MAGPDGRAPTDHRGLDGRLLVVRRGFREFLTIPVLMVAGFLILAAVTYGLDRGDIRIVAPLRDFMQRHIFANAEATGELLGTIAAGLITVTSITFSLLLLALQQSGATLTSQVFDQFLRRRTNQIYFGFFVGLALYSLVVLATVDAPFNPVYGASIALALTVVALMLLIVLLYTTIDQMRPAQIVEAIHDHTLIARNRQMDLVRRTRRAPHLSGTVRLPVRVDQHGYLTGIALDRLAGAIREAGGGVEVIFRGPIGTFIAYEDALAEVVATDGEVASRLADAVRKAVQIDRMRDLRDDPAYGIEQLATIAWTSTSTSKQDPAPGLLVTHALHDLLVRWAAAEQERAGGEVEEADILPVVYPDDVLEALFDGLAWLAVVASESMQHQVAATLYRTLAAVYGRVPPAQQARIEDLALRSLSALGEHVPVRRLDDALIELSATFRAWGRRETAARVEEARAQLAGSIGHLGARSTRVPQQ